MNSLAKLVNITMSSFDFFSRDATVMKSLISSLISSWWVEIMSLIYKKLADWDFYVSKNDALYTFFSLKPSTSSTQDSN